MFSKGDVVRHKEYENCVYKIMATPNTSDFYQVILFDKNREWDYFSKDFIYSNYFEDNYEKIEEREIY